MIITMEMKVYYAKPLDNNEGLYENHVKKCYDIASAELDKKKEILESVLKTLEKKKEGK